MSDWMCCAVFHWWCCFGAGVLHLTRVGFVLGCATPNLPDQPVPRRSVARNVTLPTHSTTRELQDKGHGQPDENIQNIS